MKKSIKEYLNICMHLHFELNINMVIGFFLIIVNVKCKFDIIRAPAEILFNVFFLLTLLNFIS